MCSASLFYVCCLFVHKKSSCVVGLAVLFIDSVERARYVTRMSMLAKRGVLFAVCRGNWY